MQANAIHLGVESLITVAKAMSSLANLNVSVRPPVIGHQRNFPHVSVSKILDLKTNIILFFICVNLTVLIMSIFMLFFFLVIFFFDAKRERELNIKFSIE